MLKKLVQIWKIPDLRKNILFILAMLGVFRLAAHIPVPGINVENLKKFFESNEILGLLNIFSGGSMENFSVVMLGVAPYITASIIFQLLIMIVPRLEELSKEEYGRQKINQWTRILTVPMAFLNAYGMIAMFRQSANPIITDTSPGRIFLTLLTVTAGTIFLMWIGELISEKKIGNGISILIFAGIVARVPSAIREALLTYESTRLLTYILFIVVSFLVIAGVVFVNEGERKIPVNYAKRVRGIRMYGGVSSYLPIRVNQAGVIPIIFAISVLLFPQFVAQLAVIFSKNLSIKLTTIVNQLFNNVFTVSFNFCIYDIV